MLTTRERPLEVRCQEVTSTSKRAEQKPVSDDQGKASVEEKTYKGSSAASEKDLLTQKVFRAVYLNCMFS